MDNGNDLSSDNNETIIALSNQILESKEQQEFPEDETLWIDYRSYLSLKVSKTTASNLFRYAKQYYYIIKTRNASDLQLLSQEKRIHVMKALSSLSKFLGFHDQWKILIEKFDLKWTNSNYTNNTFFKIFNSEVEDMKLMIDWLR
jgi:hypothetical protein